MDPAFGLEAPPQRSRGLVVFPIQPVPGSSTTLYSGCPLQVHVRATWKRRRRVVDKRIPGELASSALHSQSPLGFDPRFVRLDRPITRICFHRRSQSSQRRPSRNQNEISQQGNKDGLVHSKIAKAAKTDFRKFKGPVFATFVALLWNLFSSW